MSEGTRIGTARALSIIGHPMITLSASALAVSIFLGAMARTVIVVGIALLFGLGLGAWARRKVNSGQWSHVDAIHPGERREWNRVLLVCFVGIAVGFAGIDPVVAITSLALAFILLCAIILAPWLKLSQHTAYAVFSAWVVGSVEPLAGYTFAVFAVAVAWSRLALLRHTVIEVLVGAACGSLAGLSLWMALEEALG
ncbi:MAG: hypothetical protein AAF687_01610 [Pseudomonadota bacterium]